MKTVLVLATLLLLVRAGEGKTCSTDAECGDEECCQILSEFMVVSKRAGAGTCQPYIQEGQPCDIFGRINGFCSCYPGYACVALEVPLNDTEAAVNKRMMVAPRPGYKYDIKCVKDVA
ncbi:hypothetical protein BsWGS_05804 [Bradybaena similaris]